MPSALILCRHGGDPHGLHLLVLREASVTGCVGARVKSVVTLIFHLGKLVVSSGRRFNLREQLARPPDSARLDALRPSWRRSF
jgi:hypothetical protein